MKIQDMNRDQLREAAKMLNIQGRSKMKADELRKVVAATFRTAPIPLTNEARRENYAQQNGADRLTPAQIRRANKKLLKNGK